MGFSTLIQYHDDFMDKYGDARIKNLPLMGGPFPTVAICMCYILLAKHLGPYLMENRKPFKLKKVLLVYNMIQVTWSAFAVYEGVRMAYLYYVSKFVEMLDTVFFIMRKKMNQVSTLHIIHHGIMPFSCWWGTKFFPGGHATYWAFWNCLVHVVMYSYYLPAGLGPRMQKYLWWKKYLTVFQLVQFVAIWIHSTQVLFNGCNYSKIYSAYISSHGVLFFYLFSQFYKNEYKKGGKNREEAIPKTLNMCSPSASNGGNYYEDSGADQIIDKQK